MKKMNKGELLEQGMRLKLFRNSLKMTQAEFGKSIGRDQTSIQKYETGLNSVPSAVIKVVIEKFDMSIDWFYYGEGAKKINKAKGLPEPGSDHKTDYALLELRIDKLEKTVNELLKIINKQNIEQ